MDADARGYVADLIRTAEEHLGRARALLEDAESMIVRGGHPPSPEPRGKALMCDCRHPCEADGCSHDGSCDACRH